VHEPDRVSKSRIKRLRAMEQPQYRLRVEDYRVFYDIIDSDVLIIAIVPKANVDE
jgi:mRNA interferase RelE/StbE